MLVHQGASLNTSVVVGQRCCLWCSPGVPIVSGKGFVDVLLSSVSVKYNEVGLSRLGSDHTGLHQIKTVIEHGFVPQSTISGALNDRVLIVVSNY